MIRHSLLTLAIVFSLVSSTAKAQVVTATVLGSVTDASGAVLPGVTVTIRNAGTGQTRTTVTDGQGRYREVQLAIGPYEVRAELQGFKTQVRPDIVLTVGAEVVINLSLGLGTVSETVVVTGEAPLVQTSTTEVGALVDQKMLQQLPLNARDIQQLAVLQPGVQSQRYNFYGPEMVVRGSRPSTNRFLLNGVDSANSFGTSPVSAAGIIMGMEGLQEFKILTSDYGAAYGIKPGGVVNMVTKSGTNNFHGSGYEFQRHNTLDSKNYFDQGSSAPPFNREQFGASIGGPVVSGKTFFFANYEQLRHRLSLSNVAIVPDAQARLGNLPDPTRPGQYTAVGLSPSIIPYMNLIPQPNGKNFGDGTAQYFSNPLQVVGDRYMTVRFDHQVSSNDALWGVYTGDWADSLTPQANPNFADHVTTRKNIFSIQNVHTFSASLVHTLRAGFNRSWYFDRADTLVPIDSSLYAVPDPYFAPTPQAQFPQIAITGLSSLGNTPNPTPVWYQHTAINIDSDFNYTRGAHSWQFGGTFQRWYDDGDVANAAARGDYTFQSLRTFLQGKPSRVNIYLPGSDPSRKWRNNIVGLYAQDDMRLRSNLTVSAGLRWETVYGPTEADGKLVNIAGPLAPSPMVGSYINQPRANFEPRLGLNWDVFGDGKTSVRGGGGIFDSLITPYTYHRNIGADVPFTTQLSITNPTFPNPYLSVFPNAPPDFVGSDINPNTPRLISYHAALQRQLFARTTVTVGYVGSLGRYLPRNAVINTADENIPYPQVLSDGTYYWPASTTARPNPNFGRIAIIHYDGSSTYNSLQLTVDRRIGQGFGFGGNYTYGICTDDVSDEYNQAITNTSATLQYSRDVHSSRGNCSYNSNHSMNLTTTWDLPGKEMKGIAGGFFGRWRWSTITSLQSGLPFEVTTGFNNSRQNVATTALGDRPSFAPGCNADNAITGNPAQWFDPNCFVLPPPGYLGAMPSRSLHGPALFTSDWALAKTFMIRGDKRIEVQAQVFNITNRANFSVPSARTLWTDANTRIASAGQITSTITPARQVQVGLRFAF
jgi:outer membrane receptor protein involved in Fe transport